MIRRVEKIMNKRGEIAMGALIMFFIGVVVVAAILPSIAENTELMENKQRVINESINYASAFNGTLGINTSYELEVANDPKDSADWRASSGDISCPLSSFALFNGSYEF